jgi:hypothetical protein
MHVFNAFLLGDVTTLFDWLESNVGDFEYESPKHPPEPHSYYFERRGAGWRFKYITTLNHMDVYPDDFVHKQWHVVGAESFDVRHYSVVELDSDADAVMFKLRWTGHASI